MLKMDYRVMNFYLMELLKESDGTIYFGGSNGVSYVQPEKYLKIQIHRLIDISL